MARNPQTGLTELQQRFVSEYVSDLNATAAYVRAGYSAKRASAEASACRLLGIVKVQNAIQRLMEKRAKATKVTTERVVNRLADIAFAPDGKVRDRDRIRALELLGKHTGGFADRMKVQEERERVPIREVTVYLPVADESQG